jgi:hypothetical protein
MMQVNTVNIMHTVSRSPLTLQIQELYCIQNHHFMVATSSLPQDAGSFLSDC